MLKFVSFIRNVIKFRLRSIKISRFLFFCRNFSENVDFARKNLNNETCDFDDKIIFGIGSGERIVLNDIKPVGDIGNKVELNMAFAYNLKRDIGVLGLNEDLENENVFTKST